MTTPERDVGGGTAEDRAIARYRVPVTLKRIPYDPEEWGAIRPRARSTGRLCLAPPFSLPPPPPDSARPPPAPRQLPSLPSPAGSALGHVRVPRPSASTSSSPIPPTTAAMVGSGYLAETGDTYVVDLEPRRMRSRGCGPRPSTDPPKGPYRRKGPGRSLRGRVSRHEVFGRQGLAPTMGGASHCPLTLQRPPPPCPNHPAHP